MTYDNPEISIDVEYYTIKGKKPIKHYLSTDSETCREEVVYEMRNDIPLIPIRFLSKHGKYYPKCYIFISEPGYLMDDSHLSITSKNLELLHIIVGTISRLILHSKEDNEWRKKMGYNLQRDEDIDGYIYSELPPTFTSNPVLISLMLGLIRDCLNASAFYSDSTKRFISRYKLQSKKIKGKSKDKELFYSTIEPFLLSLRRRDYNFTINNRNKHLLEYFIEEDINRIFPIELTNLYWNLECSFGFDSFNHIYKIGGKK